MNRSLAFVAFFALIAYSTGRAPASAKMTNTVDVKIVTSLGSFVVRLESKRAPKTTANFLHYVDAKTYDGTSFYRTVSRKNEPQAPFEVIQGGVGAAGASGAVPIPLEPTTSTGLHNGDGAVAMARTNDPDSATTEFFVDIGDARYLDAGGPLGPGYAVFGHVVSGMAVVRAIHVAKAAGEALQPPIRILTMRRR